MGADDPRRDDEDPRARGRYDRSADRLAASGRDGRSRCRLSAGPLVGADRPDALRRVRPGTDHDDLHRHEPVQGHPGGPAAIPDGCQRAVASLRGGDRRRAGASQRGRTVLGQSGAADRQSSRPVPVGHAVVQPGTRRLARPGRRSHQRAAVRDPDAVDPAGPVPGQRAGLPGVAVLDPAAGRGRHPGGLYRAGDALRELYPSGDHPVRRCLRPASAR